MAIIAWIITIFFIIAIGLSFFTVNTAQVAIITRFGKFLRVANPGLNMKIPFIDVIDVRMSLRVNQIVLTMETKTKDNVFVTIPISVQNRVRPEKYSTPTTNYPIPKSKSNPTSSKSSWATYRA